MSFHLTEHQLVAKNHPSSSLLIQGNSFCGKTTALLYRMDHLSHQLTIAPEDVLIFAPHDDAVQNLIGESQRLLGEKTQAWTITTPIKWVLQHCRTHTTAPFSIWSYKEQYRYMHDHHLWPAISGLSLEEWVHALEAEACTGQWPDTWTALQKSEASTLRTLLDHHMTLSSAKSISDCVSSVIDHIQTTRDCSHPLLIGVDDWHLHHLFSKKLVYALSSMIPVSITTCVKRSKNLDIPSVSLSDLPNSHPSIYITPTHDLCRNRAESVIDFILSQKPDASKTWILTDRIDDQLALHEWAIKKGLPLSQKPPVHTLFPSELDRLYAYLTVLSNPHDALAVREVAQSLGISAMTVDTIWQAAVENKVSIAQLCRQSNTTELLQPLIPLFAHIDDLVEGYQDSQFGTLSLLYAVLETALQDTDSLTEEKEALLPEAVYTIESILEDPSISLQTLLDLHVSLCHNIPDPPPGRTYLCLRKEEAHYLDACSCDTVIYVGDFAPTPPLVQTLHRALSQVWLFAQHPIDTHALHINFPHHTLTSSPPVQRCPSYTIGDQVLHPQWGKGTLHTLELSSNKTIATIVFATETKQVVLEYAPLVWHP